MTKSTQMAQHLNPIEDNETIAESNEEPIDWRNGPAKYWYDLYGLPIDCQSYDYGFKLKNNLKEEIFESTSNRDRIDSEDAFHLVSQTKWENEIIWNADEVRHKVLKTIKKPSIAGWIPIGDNRKAPPFIKQLQFVDNNSNSCDTIDSNVCDNNNNKSFNTSVINSSRSLRKRKAVNSERVENQCLKQPKVSYKWVSSLPEENAELVLNRWEDEVIWDSNAMDRIPAPNVIPFNSTDDSVVLSLPQFISEDTNDSSSTIISDTYRVYSTNSFNISNDEFYASINKADNNSAISHHIIHSIPASNLFPLYFPTCVRDYNTFYRPLLKRSRFLLSKTPHNVLLCNKQIQLKEMLCESESYALRDMSHFLIRSAQDLTACNGDIVLMEYSEEDPPLLMRNGMGSKIINYCKKSVGDSVGDSSQINSFKFGETKQATTSPFIGELNPGQSQSAIETNMFRAPIFEHTFPETDFLIIKTKDSFYVRSISALFVVGQELPLIEVPRPRSKNWHEFIKRFAKIFIYRLFTNQKSIKNLSNELKKAFPDMSQHMITKCVKDWTERKGDRNVLKGEIPFEDQINGLVTPEECCAFYSAAVAEQKLKERGYGDRLYLISEENENDNNLDEVAIAPWNTTLAYIATLNTKKWLNVVEYNEDASLVYSIKSYKDFKDQMPTIKKCQPVTERSLKRMTLKTAHEWLINYGMSREKVKKLKNRFECTFLIKELSDKLRQNGVIAMSKTNTTEQHYRFECQKIFNLQTSIYSSKEEFSTDEEDEEDCDSELEDMGKDLEAMFLQNKTCDELDYEKEEAERIEFIKSLYETSPKLENGKCNQSYDNKILKITRTFQNKGKTYTRTEIVRRCDVIEAYVRIRQTKNEEFIKRLSFVGNHTENESLNKSKTSKQKSNTKVVKDINNVENSSFQVNNSVSVSHNYDAIEVDVENEDLVRVDGFKLKFNKKVVDEAIKIQMEEKKILEEEEMEAMKGDFSKVEYYVPRKSTRCRVDPMVRLKDIFDKMILEVRKLDEIEDGIDFFMLPVKEKEFPDYYDIIKNPMDLKTMREKISVGKYSNRQQFLKDMELIYLNSVEYSGFEEPVTKAAQFMVQFCVQKFQSLNEEISGLEKSLSFNS